MKRLLLAVIPFCLYATISFSQLVSLGTETGAASTNVLLSTSTTTNKYSRTISVYTATEITAAGGVAGAFTSLWWKKGGTGEYTAGDATLIVYIKPVTNSSWPTVPAWDTEIVGAQQVFNSTSYSLPTGTGFKQVVFGNSFAWDGSSNIAIFVDWYRPGTPTADISWSRSTTASANASRVGGTLASLNPMLVNSNRPLVQLQIVPPLPVQLSSFTGLIRNGWAYLNWQTQTEQNTDHFEIEASVDGTVFTKYGSVVAAGNTSTPKQYTFSHPVPAFAFSRGWVYYRLKTVDKDGKASYSTIMKLPLQQRMADITVYPNPVKDVFTLSVSQGGTGKVSYTLSAMDGRTIARQANGLSGSGVLTMNALATQPAGIYLLKVWVGDALKLMKVNKE